MIGFAWETDPNEKDFDKRYDDIDKKIKWWKTEIPSWNTMLYSLKHPDKFIVGTYAEEFKSWRDEQDH